MPKLARFAGRQGDLVVHHINGDDTDNRPENLLFCTRTKHQELLYQLEHLAFELVNEGKIVLKDGEYRRNFPLDPAPTEQAAQPEQSEQEAEPEETKTE